MMIGKKFPTAKLITFPAVPGVERKRILELLMRTSRFSKWIDLGCGESSATVDIVTPPWIERVNVDIVEPVSPPSGRFIRCDIREFVKRSEFGGHVLVSLLDVIEHFPKAETMEILEELEKKSGAVVVFTPDGFYRQDAVTHPELMDKPYQWHCSGWTKDEFVNRGYTVIWFPLLHMRFGGLVAVRVQNWEPMKYLYWIFGVEKIRVRTFFHPRTCLSAIKESVRFRYGETFWYATIRNLYRKWIAWHGSGHSSPKK